MTMSDKIIDELKNGTCPFTGQRYDCARCEITPERHDIPSETPGMHQIHMNFCINQFVKGYTTTAELKRLARGFVKENGKKPTGRELLEWFVELHKYGVEVLPMCECKRFCYKHGCMGGDK
jgi:hypothetical protein